MSELDFSKGLVVFPHPDDAEFSMGGTIAKWTSEGREVVACCVTNGAMGSNDPSSDRDELIRRREEEQRKASAVLGVSDVTFLGHEDGYVEDTHELRRDIVREIRRHKPDLVTGPDPSTFYFANRYINHPDHRAVGLSFLAAVNPGAATTPLYRAELFDQGFEPHEVKICLLTASVQADWFVDISDFIDRKVEAIRVHRSQMENMAMNERLDDRVRELGAFVASRSQLGCEYAEGFKIFRLRGDDSPSD